MDPFGIRINYSVQCILYSNLVLEQINHPHMQIVQNIVFHLYFFITMENYKELRKSMKLEEISNYVVWNLKIQQITMKEKT
jgi:hypothetical protein